MELFYQEIEGLKVHSLFHWIPGEQEVLSRLVRALKGSGGQELWTHYGEKFWKRHLLSLAEARVRPLIFIPSPSLKARPDHARFFAEALVAASGGLFCSCLVRASSHTSQKRKRRKERLKAALGWNEAFTLSEFRRNTVGKQIVFVDDIVTTGGTAQAAWRCLGKPRDFAVWTLAQRGLSCGASKSLI